MGSAVAGASSAGAGGTAGAIDRTEGPERTETPGTAGATGANTGSLIARRAARLFRSSAANQSAAARTASTTSTSARRGSVAPCAASVLVSRCTVECCPLGWDPPDGGAGFAAKPAVPLHEASSPPASVATMEIGTVLTPDGIANGTRTIVFFKGATAARIGIGRAADPCTSTCPTIVFAVAPPFWNVISKKV